MKKITCFVTILLVASLIFGVVGCKPIASGDDNKSGSGSGTQSGGTKPGGTKPDDSFKKETITLTIEAGKGWIETDEDDYLLKKVKSISVELNPGDYVYKAIELREFDFYEEKDEEKNLWYSYKENGFYYGTDYELTDKDGKILTEEDWYYKKIYEDTTFSVHYRKFVPITYNLNGGYIYGDEYYYDPDTDSYVHEKLTDDIVEYELEGYELGGPNYNYYGSTPMKDGFYLGGWTLIRDGDDYITTCPSQSATLYAKWEEPKTCLLTLNSGEYSGFYRYGVNFGPTISSIVFQSGKSLSTVLNENGYNFDGIIYEGEILGKRFAGFRDSKGNTYDGSTMLTESVNLEAYTRDLYTYEVGINLNFNGVFIDGMEEFCFYTWVDGYKYRLNDESREIINDENDGYIFAGWTFTKDGNDFVDDSISGGTTTTVYAKWITEDDISELMPYRQNDDGTITFIFNPADFGLNVAQDYTVKLMCSLSYWDQETDKCIFTKNSDGLYYLTLTYESFFDWEGFMFYVKNATTDMWYGSKLYKYSIPEYMTMAYRGEPDHFRVIIPGSMVLTMDLNGGNIEGDSSSKIIELSKSEYENYRWNNIESLLEYNLGIQEPVKEGYIFAGWTLTKDGNDFVQYKYENLPYGNLTFYARWLEEKECTLTLQAEGNVYFYDSWEGTSLGSKLEYTFQSGDKLYDIFDTYRIYPMYTSPDGRTYNFSHYVDDSGNEYYTDNIILTDDITLYPVVKLIPRVFYDLNGGIYEDSEENFYRDENYINGGLKITKEGCDFIGWTLTKDGKDFVENSYTEEDVTVYAKFVRYTPESSTGIYSYTVPISEISEAWDGNSLTADFKIMLMNDEDVRTSSLDNSGNTTDLNLQVSTHKQGNFYLADGIAATVTDSDLTVFIDMSYFYTQQKPYVVALASKMHAPNDYSFTDWSADVMVMTPNAIFPTNLQQTGTPLAMLSLAYVAGTMTDPQWDPASIRLDANNSFVLESVGEPIEFKFTDGSWAISYGILDGPITGTGTYTLGGIDNVIANLPKGKYRIKLDVTEQYASVIVTKE